MLYVFCLSVAVPATVGQMSWTTAI